jgi:hypothetical protein
MLWYRAVIVVLGYLHFRGTCLHCHLIRRWKRQFIPKRRYLSRCVHGVRSQMMVLLSVLNLTFYWCVNVNVDNKSTRARCSVSSWYSVHNGFCACIEQTSERSVSVLPARMRILQVDAAGKDITLINWEVKGHQWLILFWARSYL